MKDGCTSLFAFFRNSLLPFEVISVLLLAAMIGAIAIAKGDRTPDEKVEIPAPATETIIEIKREEVIAGEVVTVVEEDTLVESIS